MKVLDLFAGIGGFRLGFEAAGHEVVGWVEKDKFARKSYEAIHNTKGEWTHDDIRTIDARSVSRADIWTFGFPCQDISVAGKQQGFDGQRSSLFFEVTRILRQIQKRSSNELPPYLVIENVKNFLSVNNGWDFLLAQAELDEIGYDCEWQLFNSAHFGVPQNRERLYIIGHLRGRSRGQILPIKRKSRATTLKAGGGAKTRLNLVPQQLSTGNGLAFCLDANYSKGISTLTKAKRTHVAVLTPDRIEKRQNGRRMKEEGEPMFTITTQDRHGVYDGYRIRKLTPLECWRLQGFPDWAFYKAKAAGVSDTQLYKQAGNSVTVGVVYEIAKRLV